MILTPKKRNLSYKRPNGLPSKEKSSLEKEVARFDEKSFFNVTIHGGCKKRDNSFPLEYLKNILLYVSSSKVLFKLFLCSSRVRTFIQQKCYDGCRNVIFRVSNRCKKVLRKKSPYVFKLELSNVNHSIHLKCFPSLTSLSVVDCHSRIFSYGEEEMKRIMQQLEYLNLKNTNFSPFLDETQKLKEIKMSYCRNIDIFSSKKRFGTFLRRQTHLKELYFDACPNHCVLEISDLHELEKLTLLDCPNIHFFSLTKLNHLTLKGIQQPKKEDFEILPCLERLEMIGGWDGFTDSFFVPMTGTITSLRIQNNDQLSASLFTLPWKRLRELEIKKCPVSGETLSHLNDSLEVLKIEKCPNIRDIHLSCLQNLKELSIVKCEEVRDESQFAEMKKLECFRLWGNQHLTDIVLTYFESSLKCLEIGDCSSFRGLTIRTLTELQELNLLYLTKVKDRYLFNSFDPLDFEDEEWGERLMEHQIDLSSEENVQSVFASLKKVQISFCPFISKKQLEHYCVDFELMRLKDIKDVNNYLVKRCKLFS